MSEANTVAPSARNSFTVARPMPRAPPKTTATLPANRPMSLPRSQSCCLLFVHGVVLREPDKRVRASAVSDRYAVSVACGVDGDVTVADVGERRRHRALAGRPVPA